MCEVSIKEKILDELVYKNLKCCICNSFFTKENVFDDVLILHWKEITWSDEIDSDIKYIYKATCPTCWWVSFWEIESSFHPVGNWCNEYIETDSIKLIYPLKPNYWDIPEPNEDIPDDVKVLYEMAVVAYYNIPQSCWTLLRLWLEKILEFIADNWFKELKDLEEWREKWLKNKIKTLETIRNNKSDLRLNKNDVDIIKSMDLIRLKWNKTTHEIVDEWIRKNMISLFRYINFLTEEMIVRPELSKEVESDYVATPDEDKVIKK